MHCALAGCGRDPMGLAQTVYEAWPPADGLLLSISLRARKLRAPRATVLVACVYERMRQVTEFEHKLLDSRSLIFRTFLERFAPRTT